jgi:CBS domain-containing protein
MRICADAGGASGGEHSRVRIAEIMSSPVVSVSEEASLEEVARVMSEHDIGGVPVLDSGGRLVGIVTDSDFAGQERYVPFSYPATKLPAVFGEWMQGEPFEALCERARRLPARAIMSSPVVTASEEEPVETVVERMLHAEVNRIPSVRDGELVGIVARHDLLKLMLGVRTTTAVSAP